MYQTPQNIRCAPRIYAKLLRIYGRPLEIDEDVWVRRAAVDGIKICAPQVRARPLRIYLRIHMLGPSKYAR